MRFNNLSPDRSPLMDRGDKRLILLITVIYALVALINLGTLSCPQTVWNAPQEEVVRIDLGEVRDVAAVSFNGNIAVGRLLLSADDGNILDYKQEYGEMFSWRKKDVRFHTRFVELKLLLGDISLNEIAFFDDRDELLPARLAENSVGGAQLLDEQNTVPKEGTYFNGMIFDEIYHARTAYEFIHGLNVYEWTHPPLGKELIALGVLIFGMTPFGWRVVPALFGAAMLPVLFMLSKRLFRRRDYAALAAGLFSLDTMHFAQTRIATVDVFIVFFILWMYYFMVVFVQEDLLHAPMKKLLLPLCLCGLSFGLGTSSKWTGLYAGLGLAVIFFGHLIRTGIQTKRHNEREMPIFWRRALKACLFCIGAFILVPVCIYYLSYIPFYRYAGSVDPEFGFSDTVKLLLQQQESMYSYHSNLTATHICQSNWYEWPFAEKGVWFYFHSGENTVSNITSIGSPGVWWISAVGTLCLLTEALFGKLRRAERSLKDAAVFLLIGAGANLLPWTLVPRCIFQYHFFPTLPFMLLLGVLFLQYMEERGELSPRAKWIWLGVAGIYFVLLLPAVSGLPMSRGYAHFLEYVLPAGNIFLGAV